MLLPWDRTCGAGVNQEKLARISSHLQSAAELAEMMIGVEVGQAHPLAFAHGSEMGMNAKGEVARSVWANYLAGRHFAHSRWESGRTTRFLSLRGMGRHSARRPYGSGLYCSKRA